ncbi:MAG: tryptophan synthase subunit alpha, partial [Candidatus Dormibacteraeota bacterium]|nr:tryptophan synthase subunit alpha [Candidatus Dormibacteraeota bacterium]
CVGVTGVTGARSAVSADALRLLAAVRDCTQLPRALGFGLSRHGHMELLAGHTEAVVVGSALIDAVYRDPADPPRAAERFLLGMLGRREAQPA